MNKLLPLILLLPLFVSGQAAQPLAGPDLAQIYTKALGDFIQLAKKNNRSFDTLFIGNRKGGEPEDDFPDIEFPATVENTQIRLISPQLGDKMQKERRSRVYVNMVGWATKEKAEFLFFAFSNGFEYQYNSGIYYAYNKKTRSFEQTKARFEEQPKK